MEKEQYVAEYLEKYSGFDEWTLEKHLADVVQSDDYVVLLAHRYGYLLTEDNPLRKLIMQLEYEEGGRHPVTSPRLVLTIDPEHPWKLRKL